jgi:hypothetical protein
MDFSKLKFSNKKTQDRGLRLTRLYKMLFSTTWVGSYILLAGENTSNGMNLEFAFLDGF